MTCEHIEGVKKKLNDLVGKYNDTSSSYFYEECGPYFEVSDIKNCVNYLTVGVSDYLSDDSGSAVLNRLAKFLNGYGEVSQWTMKRIRGNVLYQHLSNIFDELKVCDCHNEAVRKTTDKLETIYNDRYNELTRNSVSKDEYNRLLEKNKKDVADYNELLRKNEVLAEKYKNLFDRFGEYEEYKERYEDASEALKNEKINNTERSANQRLGQKDAESKLRIEKTKIEEKLESTKVRELGLTKLLEDTKTELVLVRVEKENQVAIFENKLDQKQQLLEVVRQSLADLRVENEKEKGEKNAEVKKKDNEIKEKDNELRRKEEEINNLRSQKGLSQEELLTEKLNSGKRNLDLFSSQLEINLEQIHSLSKYHERLLVARKNHNQANVDVHEENIARVKQELSNQGINIINVQEICQKCENIAEFVWELEKARQFEARQEVPTNNF